MTSPKSVFNRGTSVDSISGFGVVEQFGQNPLFFANFSQRHKVTTPKWANAFSITPKYRSKLGVADEFGV